MSVDADADPEVDARIAAAVEMIAAGHFDCAAVMFANIERIATVHRQERLLRGRR